MFLRAGSVGMVTNIDIIGEHTCNWMKISMFCPDWLVRRRDVEKLKCSGALLADWRRRQLERYRWGLNNAPPFPTLVPRVWCRLSSSYYTYASLGDQQKRMASDRAAAKAPAPARGARSASPKNGDIDRRVPGDRTKPLFFELRELPVDLTAASRAIPPQGRTTSPSS